MTIDVVNYVIYRDNPYHRLIYADIQDRYNPVRGTIDLAIEKLDRNNKGLFHVHWEEHCLRACPTEVEARSAVQYFGERAKHYKNLGGRLCWTIHNVLPHELQHVDSFIDLRKMLADTADKIFIHNLEAAKVVGEQVPLDPVKLHYLPHPSYLGIYEDAEATGSVPPGEERTVLAFGKIRRYKGLERLLDVMSDDFMRRHALRLKIAGQPLAGDTLAEDLARHGVGRDNVTLDFRNIPDQDVPALLRGAGCVVMPYERFLTSGVSLLCLAIGVVMVAPDAQQLREVLPASCHRFLFKPGHDEDMRRALLEAVALAPEERAAIAADCKARAHYLRPARISRQLGTIYDSLLEAHDPA